MRWEEETQQDRNGGREGGRRSRERDVQYHRETEKREKTLVPPPLCDLLKL